MAGWVKEGEKGRRRNRGERTPASPAVLLNISSLSSIEGGGGGGVSTAAPHCHVPYLSALPLGCSVFWAFSTGGQ